MTTRDRKSVQIVSIRRTAEGVYRGEDTGTHRQMRCDSGRVVEVSAQKAEQLMRDFSGDWEYVGASKPEQPEQPAPPSRLTLAIQFLGAQNSSVRRVFEHLYAGFRQIGVDVRRLEQGEAAQPGEVLLTWGVCTLGQSQATYNVIIDPVDGWRWDAEAVKLRNNLAALTFGLSRHSCDMLRGFGVQSVAELPLGVDRDLWHPGAAELPERLFAEATRWPDGADIGGRFWFVAVAAWQERKGLSHIIDAFTAEFGADEPVGLIVKAIHGGGTWGSDRTKQIETALRGRKHAPILYWAAELDQPEVRDLYCSADCYVSGSMLEGWGLPPMEAIACGTPVVVTNCSGHRDYANPENAYLVECRMEPMELRAIENGLTREVARGITWGIPQRDSFRRALRAAYNDRRDKNTIPHPHALAMERTARWFSPAYSAMCAVQALRQHGINLAFTEPELPERHPRVAVCIPAWNYADLLRATLTRLEATECDGMRVLVWDDGSSDETRLAASEREWRVPVAVKGTKKHRGLLPARQSLIDWAAKLKPKPEFLLFLDGDMFSREADGTIEPADELDPQWLRRLCAAHIDGFSGPKLLLPDGRVWGAGGNVGRGTTSGNVWLSGFQRDDGPEWNKPGLCDFVPGACLLGRMDLWQKLRCDTEYPGTTCDDVDLAMQVQHVVGEHCWYRPEVTLTHNAFSQRSQNHPVNQAAKKAEKDGCRARFRQKWGRALSDLPRLAEPKQPSVFVAIPTLNYRELLLACLQALEQTTGVDLTVGVYDDGSTDGTREALQGAGTPYRLLVGGTNERQGLPHARAELVRLAQGVGAEYFCFLDADMFSRGGPPEPYMPDPQWLAKLCSLHADGISTTKILLPDGKVWSAGGTYTEDGKPTLRGFHRMDCAEWGRACEVPHVPGALMFMRSDLWQRGLVCDESFDLRGRDDTDLCYQVTRRLGERCWYWPLAVVVHNAWSARQHTPQELEQHRSECVNSAGLFERKWGQ